MIFSFAKNGFAGVSLIERVMPRSVRRCSAHVLTLGIILSFIASQGRLFAAALALRLMLFMLDSYIRSRTSDTRGTAGDDNIAGRFNYYASAIWRAGQCHGSRCSLRALATGFDRAPAGRAALGRLGITLKAYRDALAATPADAGYSQDTLTLFASRGTENREITSADLLGLVSNGYAPVKNLFLAAGSTAEDLADAASWAERLLTEQDRRSRWWSRERLAALPGIGKQWAYGRTFFLNQFSHSIVVSADITEEITGREEELQILEATLLKQSGANALLVGDPGAGKKTILAALADRISRGVIAPTLEDKRLIMLDGSGITGAGKTRGETEALLIKILNEAAATGNIILGIDQFPEFVASLSSLGISAGAVLAPYLGHPALHIVALSDTAAFRRTIASDAGLLAHFETIYLADIDRDRLITILEDRATTLEAGRRARLLITYPAIRTVADAALAHITQGALPKRAIDLLEQAFEVVAAGRDRLLAPSHISAIVAQKTHLPAGAITGDERAILQNLEQYLHSRVIGQNAAISALADAVRRARAGVRNPKRPIGSFLFLGPTGVGKTESAKALAAVYFGDEEHMIRFDMSEYQTEDAIARLLGSADRNDPGLLASAVRRRPYGVLLLDEFEKSRIEIRNLFLTILDEGFFTDALGERIIVRDMIIIATSNAGALLIQDMIAQRINPVMQKNIIIDTIEKEAHLAPELLNRFDSLIIFRPLDADALQKIAALMLGKLATRLKEQNYVMEITPELIDAVAAGGFDPQFGARPMTRWIQDHVEKAVTDGILTEHIVPGSAFKINPVDYSLLP